MNTNEKPSPAFTSLDDILRDFEPSNSANGFKQPTGKVKVKKKGEGLAGLRKMFSSKEKITEPNCANVKNTQVSGSSAKTLSINCEGCESSSDLTDSVCRFRCVGLLGKEPCTHLILDNGFYKKEYGEEDTKRLIDLYEIAEGLSIKYPDVCGICAKEHEDQIDKVKKVIQQDPIKLIKGGVEVSENDEMRVSGVEKAICKECEKRTEDVVEKTMLRLKETQLTKGYDFAPLVRPFFSNSRILFEIPDRSRIEHAYDSNGAKVVLSRGDEEVYSIFPPEYKADKQRLEVMRIAYTAIIKKTIDPKSFRPRAPYQVVYHDFHCLVGKRVAFF